MTRAATELRAVPAKQENRPRWTIGHHRYGQGVPDLSRNDAERDLQVRDSVKLAGRGVMAPVLDVAARSVIALLLTAGFVVSESLYLDTSPLKTHLTLLCATLFATCFVLISPGPRTSDRDGD